MEIGEDIPLLYIFFQNPDFLLKIFSIHENLWPLLHNFSILINLIYSNFILLKLSTSMKFKPKSAGRKIWNILVASPIVDDLYVNICYPISERVDTYYINYWKVVITQKCLLTILIIIWIVKKIM